jgi:CheY-like chemotaxis protein
VAKLLLVDDDNDVCYVLADALRSEGHEVRVAGDGSAGLEALREWRPDLVLLDVEMPILDGPDMAALMFIRDCGLEDIPILLISGVLDLSRIADLVGTPYFLGKPFQLLHLYALIERALRERTRPHPRHVPH